jgi:hypothetical protein
MVIEDRLCDKFPRGDKSISWEYSLSLTPLLLIEDRVCNKSGLNDKDKSIPGQ